jgi:hypothetical protein
MKEITVFKILSSFSAKELKEFGLFLESPAFAPRKKIKSLYSILQRDYQKIDESTLDREKIYKELFSDDFKKSGYSDATMRHLLYELQLCADRYLVMKAVESDTDLYASIRRKEYRNRKLDKLYIKALDESEKMLDKDIALSSEYFLNKYNIILERKNFESMYSDFLIKRNKKVGIEEIDDIAKNLTYYFLLALLYLNDGAEKYSKRFNNEYEKSFLYQLSQKIDITEFVTFLKEGAGNDEAGKLFSIYERFFKLFEKSDVKEYKKLKKFVLQHIHLFGTNSRSHIFFQFVKYSSINMMKEDHGKDFRKELFNIFKLMVDEGYHEHTEGTYFQVDFFRILFLMGCEEGELDWTESFVKRFAPELPPEFSKTSLHCGLAYVKFGRRDFDGALDNLNKMQNEYFNMEIDKKLLMIKIFYETKAYEQAISLMNSMQKYIDESKKVSFTLKEKINNFLKLTLKLIKLSGKVSSRGASTALQYEIEKEEQLYGKRWLLEKVGN